MKKSVSLFLALLLVLSLGAPAAATEVAPGPQVISCPEMAVGEACLLTIGEFSEEITPEETAGTFGKTQGIMFGGMGGHGGPGFNGDQMPSFDGERPERPFFDGNRPEPPFEGEIQ